MLLARQLSKIFKELSIPFDSILPSEIDDFDGDLIVTTEKEAPKQISIPILFDEIISKDPIVVKGIITKMLVLVMANTSAILCVCVAMHFAASIP